MTRCLLIAMLALCGCGSQRLMVEPTPAEEYATALDIYNKEYERLQKFRELFNSGSDEDREQVKNQEQRFANSKKHLFEVEKKWKAFTDNEGR